MPSEARFPLAGKRVFVAGHRGMVGSALVRRLASEDCTVLTVGREALDLLDQAATRAWFTRERPDAVFMAAAKVGGILANSEQPADFIHDNLVVQCNVIDAAYRTGVGKLMFLGSSCIYPKFAEQPIREESLLSGPLEPTNEPYAIAKIAGIGMCSAYRRQHGCDFVSVMPTNLYGPGDNFDLSSSHVLPALIAKAHAAQLACAPKLVIWGSGTPRREFLHVDDLADACVFLMSRWSADQHLNIGYGDDIAIFDLAHLVARAVGFTGTIECDTSKPDGTPRKLLDSGRLRALGWAPSIALEDGIATTYEAFLAGHGRRVAA